MNDQPENPRINPYAPPSLSEPANQLTPATPDMSMELHVLELIKRLTEKPIQASACVEQTADPGEEASDTSTFFKMTPNPATSIALLAIVALLTRVPGTRVFGLLLLLATAVVLLALTLFSYRNRPVRNIARRPSRQPAGDYMWLITDGGILVTTPAQAQWAIPWSLVERIVKSDQHWQLQFTIDIGPQWRMPFSGIGGPDSELFQQLTTVIPFLASARRNHPVCYAEQILWSDALSVSSGLNWSLLTEGGRVWFDIKGLVCSLPSAKCQTHSKKNSQVITVTDAETEWNVDLK